MICPRCRKVYSDKLNYCISCGVELVKTLPDENPAAEIIEAPVQILRSVYGDNVKIAEAASPTPPPEIEAELAPLTKLTEIPLPKMSLPRRGAAFLLSVLVFAVSISAAATAAGRILSEKKSVDAAIGCTDFLSIPASELGLSQTELYTVSDSATLGEAISVMAAGTGISESGIRQFYEASSLKTLASSAAEGYAEFLRSGKQPEKLTVQALQEAFDLNSQLITENLGVELTEADRQLARSEMERFAPALEKLSVTALEKSPAGRYIKPLRAFISLPALVGEIGLGAVLVMLTALCCKRLSAVLKHTGTAVMLAGLAFLAATFSFTMQLGISGTALTSELIRAASSVTSDRLYLIGGAMFFAGAAAVIWGTAMKKLNK